MPYQHRHERSFRQLGLAGLPADDRDRRDSMAPATRRSFGCVYPMRFSWHFTDALPMTV